MKIQTAWYVECNGFAGCEERYFWDFRPEIERVKDDLGENGWQEGSSGAFMCGSCYEQNQVECSKQKDAANFMSTSYT